MTTPLLTTKRLCLRPIRFTDAQAVFDCWMQDADVSRYMLWQSSDDIRDAENFISFELTQLDSPSWYRWIIEQAGAVIGTCLLEAQSAESAWELSYNLGKAYWRKGYATEAMERVLRFADAVLGVQSFFAVHARENPASGRVLEKLGFAYHKDVPYLCGDGFQTVGRCYTLSL